MIGHGVFVFEFEFPFNTTFVPTKSLHSLCSAAEEARYKQKKIFDIVTHIARVCT